MGVTYISMPRGFVYLAVVIDWFSRRVLAWRLSIAMEAAFWVEALEKALAHHSRPEILQHRSGQPVHQRGFHRCADQNRDRHQLGGKGAWYDNVFVERIRRSQNTRRSTFQPGPGTTRPRPS